MNKNIPYTLIDTAGQTTAVIDVPVLRSQQPTVSKPLMKSIKNIGQVCFIEKENDIFRLQMMGNELSVNGCAAGAFYWLRKTRKITGMFETSGDGLVIEAKIKSNNSITIKFPKKLIESVNGNVVAMTGIKYLLSPDMPNNLKLSATQRSQLEELANDAPASGIIFYANSKIVPLIYVKATNTFVWETSCGSGSIAYSAVMGKKIISQPSGSEARINITDKEVIYSVGCRMLE